MTIECSGCSNDQTWLCWDGDRWICKQCYLQEENTHEDWNDLNEENKRYRQEKRNKQAARDWNDF